MSPAPAWFADLGVPSDLCARLDAAAITDPFPIQSAVIPDALAGRDVAGRAPTGSGKTLAFGLPLVARLRPRSAVVRPPSCSPRPASWPNRSPTSSGRSCANATTTSCRSTAA